MYESTSWGDYPDERASLPMGDLRPRMAGLNYAPNLGPVGAGAGYYPGSVLEDGRALSYLGYLDPDIVFDLTNGYDTTGSAAGDMQGEGKGAWLREFRMAVEAFQKDVGIEADGWIGPITRGAILAAVARKNAQEMPSPLPIPPPPIPIPNQPSNPSLPSIPSHPSAQNVSARTDNTKRNVLIGAGVVGGLGLLYFLMKD